jgi:hypothetical protein
VCDGCAITLNVALSSLKILNMVTHGLYRIAVAPKKQRTAKSLTLTVPAQQKHIVLGPSNQLKGDILWKTDGTTLDRAVVEFMKQLRGR